MSEKWSRVRSKIAANADLSKAAFRVVIALGKYADNNWTCFPSQDQLAEDCAVSRRTIAKAIKELSSMGWLVITPVRRENGKFLHNTYYLANPTEDGGHVNPVVHMDGENNVQPCEQNGTAMCTPGSHSHVNPVVHTNCPSELPIIKIPIGDFDFFEGLPEQPEPSPSLPKSGFTGGINLLANMTYNKQPPSQVGSGNILHKELTEFASSGQAWNFLLGTKTDRIAELEAAITEGRSWKLTPIEEHRLFRSAD